MKKITLKEWKEKNYDEGWSYCSKMIDKTGKIRFTSVDSDWWIYCPDSKRTFSCTPLELVEVRA